MTGIALQAMEAAEAEDSEALFEIGGHIYNVCVACHQVYAREDEATGEAQAGA
jgi:cytochrome c551/c552